MAIPLRSPGELIAALPALLGFTPAESIVVVGLGGQGAVGPLLRVDRADMLVVEAAGPLVRAIAGELARHGVVRAVLLSFREGGVRQGCAALDDTHTLLSERVDVLDAWLVSEGRFRSLSCADVSCCPTGGRPVPPAPALPIAARAVAGAHAERDAAPFARRKRVAAAHLRWTRRGAVSERAAWRRKSLEEWRRAVAGARQGILPSDAEMGRLSAALSDVAVRDAFVVDMVPGEQAVAESLCADPAAPGVREALAAMITSRAAVVPDCAELTALADLCEHGAWLCTEAAGRFLTLAGLALWWQGDEAAAIEAVAEALRREPGYRLAELVACALSAGMAPGWIAAA